MACSNWQEVTLGDLVDIVHGFAFKGEFFRDDPPGDVLLTPGNFQIGGGFKWDKLKFYDGPVPEDYVLEAGDLLVTMTDLSKESDTLGFPALVPVQKSSARFLHNQRLGKIRFLPGALLDKRYLFYALCTDKYRHEILASATGTTVKHTSPTRIKKYRFQLPPLPEQRAIAYILGTLDDKIELNRQMNQTLEEMARAIFQSWFVDFDPVHAKVRGEQPAGLDPAIADLFPDRFVETEIGLMPAGWRVTSILEFADRLSGGTPKTSNAEYWDGDIKWVSAKDVGSSHGTFVIDTERKVTQLGIDNSSAKILPAKTTVVTARGTVGSYCLLAEAMSINQTNYGLKSKFPVGDYFVFFSLANLVEWLQRNSYGTIFDTITTRTFEGSRTVFPKIEILNQFEEMVSPIMELMKSNLYESKTLAELRDTLLPKLMSGELRVSDVENTVENVA